MTGLLGVGADIMRIDRVRSSLESHAFVDRVFTPAEVQAAHSRPDAGAYFAKLFSGKEAVWKCLAPHSASLRSWREIEVLEGAAGEPVVNLRGACGRAAAAHGVERVMLSLSYDTEYAVAVAAAATGDPSGK